jgi:hypothetical protein
MKDDLTTQEIYESEGLSRSFKGIWLSAELLSMDLPPRELMLYAQIDSLSDTDQGCFASNLYFSKLLHVSTTQVQRMLKDLRERGLIHSKLIYRKGTKQVIKRYLKLGEEVATPHHVNVATPHHINATPSPHKGARYSKVSKTKFPQQRRTNPSVAQIVCEEKLRLKNGDKDTSKAFKKSGIKSIDDTKEEYADMQHELLMEGVEDDVRTILDDTCTWDTESMEAAHKSLIKIAGLPHYYKMSPEDVLLMEKVMEDNSDHIDLSIRILRNIARIKTKSLKPAFGQLFFGTTEMVDNRESIAS